MHETGGNIGFIVTKSGLQAGAKKYLQSTNIIGLTYLDLQHRYMELWWKKWFMLKIGSAVDTLVQYVEPINSKRERLLKTFPEQKQLEFGGLLEQYATFGITMAFFEFPMYSSKFDIPAPEDLSSFKEKLKSELGEEFSFNSIYYRDLAVEMCTKIEDVTKKFNEVFGGNIFA